MIGASFIKISRQKLEELAMYAILILFGLALVWLGLSIMNSGG